MSRIDRAIHGPSWAEVIIGAVLSLLLGVVIGAALLIVKPVVKAKEPPKEPVPGTVYYVEGLRGDTNRARQAMVKRKALADGQSVKVTEDEINALVAAAAAPAARTDEKDKPAAPSGMISAGASNVRIRDGSMQVAVPITINVFGFEQKLVAQARGGFEKSGDVFAFRPAEVYLGSCPVQRLPFVNSYLRHTIVGAQPVPEDIAAAWPKLANVTIEGNALNLAMQ